MRITLVILTRRFTVPEYRRYRREYQVVTSINRDGVVEHLKIALYPTPPQLRPMPIHPQLPERSTLRRLVAEQEEGEGRGLSSSEDHRRLPPLEMEWMGQKERPWSPVSMGGGAS